MTRAKKKFAHWTQYPVYQTGIVTSTRPGGRPCLIQLGKVPTQQEPLTRFSILPISFLGLLFFEAREELGQDSRLGMRDRYKLRLRPYVIFR